MSKLSFESLIQYKKEKNQFPNEIMLNSIFMKKINELGSDYYDSVINAILAICTEDKINPDGMRGAEIFKHEPLKGLYKKHLRGIGVDSIIKNIGQKVFLKEYSRILSVDALKFFLEKINKRRNESNYTGYWLIFGKSVDGFDCLSVFSGEDHSRRNDSLIYNDLVSCYPKEYIQGLKAYKENNSL